MSKADNFIFHHCVERLSKVNNAEFSMGVMFNNSDKGIVINDNTLVTIAAEFITNKVQLALQKHITTLFFSGHYAKEHQFLERDKNPDDSNKHLRLFNNKHISNLRYIPIKEDQKLHAVVILVNISLSFTTQKLVDVSPYTLATIGLLNSQQHKKAVVPIKPATSKDKNEILVESLLAHTFHPTFIFGSDFKVLKCNEASQRLFHSNIERGWPSFDKLISKVFPSIAWRLLSSIGKYSFLGMLDKEEWTDVDFEHNSYQTIKVDVHIFSLPQGDGTCFGLMINEKFNGAIQIQDYFSSLARFNALTSVIPMAMLQVDNHWQCSYANETWKKYTKQPLDEALDEGWLTFISKKDKENLLPEMYSITSSSKHYQGEIKLEVPEKSNFWVSVNAVGIFNNKCELTGVMMTFLDISNAKRQSKKLERMANYDHLTGLLNRTFFTDRLNVALSRVNRHGIVATMFLDLDKFKIINDTLGHHIGDKVLQEVATRLQTTVRDEDSIARLGGDEFAIIFTDIADQQSLSIIANKIINAVNLPFSYEEKPIAISCSIGIAITEKNQTTPSEALRKADLALYKAKESGRNQFCFYDDTFEKDTSNVVKIKHCLTNIEDNHFSLTFQPQVNARNNEIIGFEALSRWQEPNGKAIFPEDFIKLIEENGLIQDFSFWFFQALLNAAQGWLKNKLLSTEHPIAINLSTKQLHITDFADNIINLFSFEGIPTQYFVFDITENAYIQEPIIAAKNIQKLKNAGFLIALDDYGTHYSSLALLQQIPIDFIKIDHSLIQRLADDEKAKQLVTAIIGLGNMLKLKIIAIGVDNPITKNWLLKNDCVFQQGVYFYDSLSINKYEKLLTNLKTNTSTLT